MPVGLSNGLAYAQCIASVDTSRYLYNQGYRNYQTQSLSDAGRAPPGRETVRSVGSTE